MSRNDGSEGALCAPDCYLSLVQSLSQGFFSEDWLRGGGPPFSDALFFLFPNRTEGHLLHGRLKLETNPDILSFGFLLFGLESPADPEHVAIRMAKVHLADVPRHIGGRECDLQPSGEALLVHLIHIIHPDRHPDAFVALFVSVLLKRGGVRAAAAASLRPLTKKDASFFTRSNCAERRRRSPVPQFLPSPLLKPRDQLGAALLL